MDRVPVSAQVSLESLENYCLRVLEHLEVSREHARVITDALVTTDSWGVFTHGTKPTDHGAAFLAIHTDAIMPIARFGVRIDELIDEIHAGPTAEGCARVCCCQVNGNGPIAGPHKSRGWNCLSMWCRCSKIWRRIWELIF